MDNDNKLVQKAADLYRSLRFSMKYRGLTILSAEAGNDAIAAAIVLFVCGAVYLNWSYSQDTAAGKNLGEAALVGSQNDPLLEKQKEGVLTSPQPASTGSRPGTTPSPCSRRPQRMRRPTRARWIRPTRPSRPWRTIP